MKKKKLNLSSIKVKSFVTLMDTSKEQTVRAGELPIGAADDTLDYRCSGLCEEGTDFLFCPCPF